MILLGNFESKFEIALKLVIFYKEKQAYRVCVKIKKPAGVSMETRPVLLYLILQLTHD